MCVCFSVVRRQCLLAVGNQFGSHSEEVNGVVAQAKKKTKMFALPSTVSRWCGSNNKSLREAVAASIRKEVKLPTETLKWFKNATCMATVKKFFSI